MARKTLSPGSRVDRFLVLKEVSQDALGVSYLGEDSDSISGSTRVHIREFFPAGVSRRRNDEVTPQRKNLKDTYDKGLKAFIDRNERFLQVQNNVVVNGIEVLEENGTAYLITEWPSGDSFAQLLEDDGPFSPSLMRSFLAVLLPGLSALNESELVHTGLSPETIYRLDDGYPAVDAPTFPEYAQGSESLDPSEPSPYLAPELYGEDASKVGPWTDVYGLSATCYELLTGEVPETALDRQGAIDNRQRDPVLESEALNAIEDDALVKAIKAGLQLDIEARASSFPVWQTLLDDGRAGAVVAAASTTTAASAAPVSDGTAGGGVWAEHRNAILSAAGVVLIGLLALPFIMSLGDTAVTDTEPTERPVAAQTPEPATTTEAVSDDTSIEDDTVGVDMDTDLIDVVDEIPADDSESLNPFAADAEAGTDFSARVEPEGGEEPAVEEEPSPEALATVAWLELNRDDPASLRRFLTEYTDAPLALILASERLSLLDERAWAEAEAENTEEGYRTYLNQFGARQNPPGIHVLDASEALRQISTQRATQIATVRELLPQLGYPEAQGTGMTGDLLRQIRDFQEFAQLNQTGQVTPELIAALRVAVRERARPIPPVASPSQPVSSSAESASASTGTGTETTGTAGPPTQPDVSTTPIIRRPTTGGTPEEPEVRATPTPESTPEVVETVAISEGTLARPDPSPRRVGEVFRDCPTCPQMRVLPSGRFTMGSPRREAGRNDTEGPTRGVEIGKPFAIGVTEVTVREFRAYLNATGRSAPTGCFVEATDGSGSWAFDGSTGFSSPGFQQTDDHPAVCLSWNDAKSYLTWLTSRTGEPYRLATEAEWEYATRGGTTGARFWGRSIESGCAFLNGADATAAEERENWITTECDDGFLYSAPVRSFEPNPNSLYDTVGNVWEWVDDCFSRNYSGAPTDGSANTTSGCSSRVIRGGSWASSPDQLRSAKRSGDTPDSRYNILGLRVVRDVQ